jgi:hypothetical protein
MWAGTVAGAGAGAGADRLCSGGKIEARSLSGKTRHDASRIS